MAATSTTTVTRHVACEGAFNIRDLGGYRTRDGSTTRWGTLYRADGLHRVPSGCTGELSHLGWRTLIDLRTSDEVAAGTFLGSGPEVVHLPMLRTTWGVPEEADIEPVGFLSGHYLAMLHEGAGAIAATFAVLASTGRLPVVFHCSAGKDRTGVLAALVLGALGVPDEVIAADYHLSANAVERLVAWLRATRPGPSEEMARQPPAFLACPPEAMLTFLAALRERHSSVGGYLASIGVGSDVVAAVATTLLEPA